MRRLAVVIAGLLLVAGPAASQRISIGLGLGLTFVGGVAGPIDPIGAPASAAYSFRLLRQGYLGTGAAVRLRRASDNAESDIGFSGSGDFDTASATTFCNATSCFVRTWYDQSGNARNMTQATAANQPAFIFNCQGALPCARSTAAAMRLATAAFTPQAIGTYTGVARRSTGTSQINYILVAGGANNNIYIDSVANKWVNGATGNISTTAATEGAFHTGIAVMNGAGAVLNVDGVETTGTVTGGTSTGTIQMLIGGAGTTFDETEAILWDGYALTAAERTALTANQRAYFGF